MGRNPASVAAKTFFLLALAANVLCFKEADFKKCKDAAFCNRLRGVVAANYSVDPASLQINDGVASLVVTNDDENVPFKLAFTAYNGIIRIMGQERDSAHRFQVPDVLMPAISSPKAVQPLQLKVEQDGAQLTVGMAFVTIAYKPFKLTVGADGAPLFVVNGRQLFHIEHLREKQEGDPDGWWEESFKSHKDSKPKGPQAISLDLSLPGFSHLYGLPERATSFALKPTVGEGIVSEPYRLYNLDVFEYLHESPFGLYGSVPFLIAHKPRRTIGAFWLNAAEMYVDVGLEADGGSSTQWVAESGLLDLFLLLGPTPSDVTEQYGWLTGTTALPQLFGIAYHQCRWNYKDEEDVANVDAGFDAHAIPYDVLWLDIEHTDGKRYMTWDKRYFPNPAPMQLDLASRGRKTVTIIDPHVKRDTNYAIFNDAESQGHYVKTAENKDFDGWCWPGSSSYLDVVSPAVRDWWAGQFSLDAYVGSTKYLYVWNDMNEPSVFNGPEITMPKDNLHHGGAEHRDVHNAYGYYYHMATAQGLFQRGAATHADGDRPFVLSRAFFSGTQRVGPIWTGDNSADWDHLRVSIPMLLSVGLTGVTFSGADVGGFFGNPDAELMTRWYQLGAYYPFFRGHAHLEAKRREPWLFGDEATERIRTAIRARYALLPYLYTLFRQANTTGAPIMRPLWYEFPDQTATFSVEDAFLVGPWLLVAPVLEAAATSRTVLLPSGVVWYDGTTGVAVKPAWDGASKAFSTTLAVSMDSTPTFLRGGGIIARKDRPRRSTVAMAQDPLTLVVALDGAGKAAGHLYIDDGSTYAFARRREYTYIKFTFEDGLLRGNMVAGDTLHARELVDKIIVLGLAGGPAKWKVKLVQSGHDLEAAPGPLTFAPGQPDSALVVRSPQLPVTASWSLQFYR